MLPGQRDDVWQQLGRDLFPGIAQSFHGPAEINRVPQHDRGHHQVEARGAMTLVLEGPVTQLAQAMEEHGALEGVLRFTLVQADMGAPPQFRVLQPVQRGQGR